MSKKSPPISIALSVATALLPVQALHAQSATENAAPETVEEVSIIGLGESREVAAITAADVDEVAPGTSVLKVVAKLPGVNFQAADPYGAYEWAVRISVRGFNQNQMGFTLDGVPLGDMSYGNFNGLHISRAIIQENLGKTVLSQGTGSLATASTSNLGGALEFSSADPLQHFGVEAAQTVGSDNALRSYGRIDSGTLSSGASGYLSFAHQSGNKWKGTGEQYYNQANLKIVQPLGAVSTLTGFVDYSNRKEVDYQDLSLEYIKKLGYKWDNYYPDWQEAIAAAQGTYTHGEDGTSDALDAAYYAGSGLRRDALGMLTLDAQLASGVQLKLTPYWHRDIGRGTWYTPYVASPSGAPISQRTTEYNISRYGVVSALSWQLDSNDVQAGLWYEHNDFDQARRYYDAGGADALEPAVSPYDYAGDWFLTQWQYDFVTKTLQPYVEDTLKLSDALKLNFGAKASRIETTATTESTGEYADGTQLGLSPNLDGTIKTDKNFLPQAGLVWTIENGREVFAGVAQNMRAFQAARTGLSPFATTQAAFDAVKDTLKPETSWTYEAGYRYAGDPLELVASVYHVLFHDRLLGISSGSGIQGNPTILANVGDVVTNGADVSLLWHVVPGLSWYNAASYNKSTYQDDVRDGDGNITMYTKGKYVVDTPKVMLKSELSYEAGGVFANLSGDYMSERYFTYTNGLNTSSDGLGKVGGRFVANAGVGYKTAVDGWFKQVKTQFNIYNLLDRRYVSTIGTNGYGAVGDNQTMMVGAPRQFFITVEASL